MQQDRRLNFCSCADKIFTRGGSTCNSSCSDVHKELSQLNCKESSKVDDKIDHSPQRTYAHPSLRTVLIIWSVTETWNYPKLLASGFDHTDTRQNSQVNVNLHIGDPKTNWGNTNIEVHMIQFAYGSTLDAVVNLDMLSSLGKKTTVTLFHTLRPCGCVDNQKTASLPRLVAQLRRCFIE